MFFQEPAFGQIILHEKQQWILQLFAILSMKEIKGLRLLSISLNVLPQALGYFKLCRTPKEDSVKQTLIVIVLLKGSNFRGN